LRYIYFDLHAIRFVCEQGQINLFWSDLFNPERYWIVWQASRDICKGLLTGKIWPEVADD